MLLPTLITDSCHLLHRSQTPHLLMPSPIQITGPTSSHVTSHTDHRTYKCHPLMSPRKPITDRNPFMSPLTQNRLYILSCHLSHRTQTLHPLMSPHTQNTLVSLLTPITDPTPLIPPLTPIRIMSPLTSITLHPLMSPLTLITESCHLSHQ